MIFESTLYCGKKELIILEFIKTEIFNMLVIKMCLKRFSKQAFFSVK